MSGPGFGGRRDLTRLDHHGRRRGRGRGRAVAASDGGEWGGTNVQEAGVDEPDSIKTDGTYVLTLGGGLLRIVDMASGTPTQLGALPAPFDAQLLVDGATALVLSGGVDGMSTDLTAIDIEHADRAHGARAASRGWLADQHAHGRRNGARRDHDRDTSHRVRPGDAEPRRRDCSTQQPRRRAGVTDRRLAPARAIGVGRRPRRRRAAAVDLRRRLHAGSPQPRAWSTWSRSTSVRATSRRSTAPVWSGWVQSIYTSADHLYVTSSGWASGSGSGDVTDVHQFAIAGREPAASSHLVESEAGSSISSRFRSTPATCAWRSPARAPAAPRAPWSCSARVVRSWSRPGGSTDWAGASRSAAFGSSVTSDTS